MLVLCVNYRDLPVSMVRQALLDQRALREIVVPRDTKVFVDLQEIREPMELGDPQDLLAPGVTRCVYTYNNFIAVRADYKCLTHAYYRYVCSI